MVDEAVKNAKIGETQSGKETLVRAGELKAVEKTLSERIFGRILDTGLYRPPLGSSYYRPSYYYPYHNYNYLERPSMPYGLESSMTRVLGLHDYINRYETTNRVIGHVTDPGLTEILGVMYDLINKKEQPAAAGGAANSTAPAAPAKALTQMTDNNQKLVV